MYPGNAYCVGLDWKAGQDGFYPDCARLTMRVAGALNAN